MAKGSDMFHTSVRVLFGEETDGPGVSLDVFFRRLGLSCDDKVSREIYA